MDYKIIDKWDLRYLNLAREIASWSKDPSSKIGAVAVGAKREILSTGYNGFPRNMNDSPDLYENREVKYQRVIHAEMNVIYNASFNGVSLDGATLYIDGIPLCSSCCLGVIQVGFKKVVMRYPQSIIYDTTKPWGPSTAMSRGFLKEAGVHYVEYPTHD